jgi:hypothetical protein
MIGSIRNGSAATVHDESTLKDFRCDRKAGLDKVQLVNDI